MDDGRIMIAIYYKSFENYQNFSYPRAFVRFLLQRSFKRMALFHGKGLSTIVFGAGVIVKKYRMAKKR